MRQYLDLIGGVLTSHNIESLEDAENAVIRADRTGVGTYSVFGRQLRFNLDEGFPLVTTKKVHLRSVIIELLWMLQGNTNVRWLQERGVRIWDEWADENGELGSIYGKLWRRFSGPQGEIDQISRLIERLKSDPYSRRHLVVSFHPADQPEIAPQGCHSLFQFYVSNDRRLSLQLYQRSADLMLGVPFNIAAYSLLLMMIAQVCDFQPHEFVHTFGDVHIYANHLAGALEQISREPHALPQMKLNPLKKDIFSFEYEDFTLEGYSPHSHIPFKIAV